MAKFSQIFKTLLILLTATAPAKAAELAQLSVTPDKCVALRKGQTCYQKLRFQFSATNKGNYCLIASNQSKPLHCWNTAAAGKFVHQHASDSAVDFALINEQRSTLATTAVSIAWVYKKSRKRSRWRLF